MTARTPVFSCLTALGLSLAVTALPVAAIAADLTVGFSQIGSESGWRAAETTVSKEEAEKRGWKESEKVASDTVKTMADNGIKVPEASAKLVDGLKSVGETMTKEWLEKAGEKGQQLVDSYRKM